MSNRRTHCWIVQSFSGGYERPVHAFDNETDAQRFAAVANDWLLERSLHTSHPDGIGELHVIPRPPWDPSLHIAETGARYIVTGPIPHTGRL